MDAFHFEERLRQKPRGGAILLVGIVRPVVVEVELAIVPVEDGSVDELTIRVRILLSPVPVTKGRNLLPRGAYIFSLLNFIWKRFPLLGNISTRRKQAVSPQDDTLLTTVAIRTLVSIPEEKKVTVIRKQLCSNLSLSIAKKNK